MPKVLGFYTSAYSEPRKNLKSLGGGPYVRLNNAEPLGAIFNDVEEYESANTKEDFRVIYLSNIAKNFTIIKAFVLDIQYDFDSYLDKSTKLYMTGVRMSMFNPPYGDINYIHPIITADGTFRDTGISIKSIINEEATQLNYGSSIVVKQDLKAGQFIPIVLHRKVRGPVAYLKNFKFTIKASFAVG